MKHIVLNSGGPDSFITLKWVESTYPRDEVLPVYFGMGHRYMSQEIEAICKTAPETELVPVLKGFREWEEGDAYIHHRNAFLVLAASKFAGDGSAKIWLTVQKDELSIPDRSPLFLDSIGHLLQVLDQEITVGTPWMRQDKTDMVGWYVAQDLDVDLLMKTWSCYRLPKQKAFIDRLPCGDCPACIRRFIAFSLSGIQEKYDTNPMTSKTASEYRQRIEDYSPERQARIQEALGV